MAVIYLSEWNGTTEINDDNIQDYNVLEIGALGTHELKVDGVDVMASVVDGAGVAGDPIFTVVNGGSLTLDQELLNYSSLDSTTFNVNDTGSITLDGSGLSELSGLNNFSINFDGNGQGSFTFQEPLVSLPETLTFHVDGMEVGDQLNVPGESWNYSTSTTSSGTHSIILQDGVIGDDDPRTVIEINATPEQIDEIENDPESFFSGGSDGFLYSGTFTMQCFAAGTMITTPEGEVVVEMMKIGDMVLTAEGKAIPVKWIGIQRVGRLISAKLPVRINEGALGDGLPNQDLIVTADHGMVIDGVVINAGVLVNEGSVAYVPLQELPQDMTYYHIETEGHEVILANGAAAETYVDYLTRQSFDNYAEFLELYGNETHVAEMPRHRISARRLLPLAVRQHLGIEKYCFQERLT